VTRDRDRRVLPHNLDAEASVLGGLILRNEVLAQLDDLEVDDFYDMKHKVVFGAMRALEAKKLPMDVVTLANEIERQDKLEAIGGFAFLGELVLRVPTEDNIVAYAKIVEDKNRVRKMMLVAGDIIELGYEDGLDVEEFMNRAHAWFSAVDRAPRSTSQLIGEMVHERVRELEAMYEARQAGRAFLAGVPTGIATLDTYLGGYPLGDVTLLAGRPGMGKTAMAMSATSAATSAGFGAHVFSQEGGWRMYADRAIAREAGIAVGRLRNGKFETGDGSKLLQARAAYRKRANWRVDARGGLTADEIIRNVRKHRAELNTKLVWIDYIQIIKRTKGLSENEALDEIITAFSHAALEDDIAYLVGCQLNREVEKRTDKRPQQADLRGSGALEERPRVIVSPYRGSYYYDEPKRGIDWECDCLKNAPCPHAPSPEEFKSLALVYVLKNNNGEPGGFCRATWRGETTEMS
jgi:replicative DNA helicase